MCRRCTECEGYSHHWIPNMAFGDDGEENNQAAYECKHCNALGDECRECYGDGCNQWDDDHDSVCGGCDGEGVIHVAGGDVVYSRRQSV